MKNAFFTAVILLAITSACSRPGAIGGDASDAAVIGQGVAKFESDIFEAPVRLIVDGKPISVESPGYACPTMADVDGDGVEDLVVGQFSGGAMHFYRNLAGADELPRFADGGWIESNGVRAVVPGVW